MDATAKEIGTMQPAEKPTEDLHQGVAKILNVTPQSLNPEDNKPLEKIQEVLKTIGYAAVAHTGDESKLVRSASGKSWRQRWKERNLGMGEEQKAA